MKSENECCSDMSDSLRPHGVYGPWNSPGQNPGVGNPFPSLGDLPNPEMKPRSPELQADALPAEPQGKPKNTGVGSLSILQGNLPDPGIKPESPILQADSLLSEPPGKPRTMLGRSSMSC